MIVLGFDTATAATSVGLMLADGSISQARDDPAGEQRPGHATRLLPLADGLLSETGLGWSELDRIAVGVGPGTFTGLRIGIATARGLAQSLGVELVGVSSLRALAHGVSGPQVGPQQVSGPQVSGPQVGPQQVSGPQVSGPQVGGPQASGPQVGGPQASGQWVSEPPGATTQSGRSMGSDETATPLDGIDLGVGAGVLTVIDARRSEVFLAGYDGEREVLAPRAVSPDSVGELLESAEIGAGVDRWVALGDGALLYRDTFERVGVMVPPNSFEGHRIQASAICDLATRPPNHTPGRGRGADEGVVPDYRRRPDAEVVLRGAA
jgi:tRNA threonylcarbamoyladenosine biosynthesis protein TsaB